MSDQTFLNWPFFDDSHRTFAAKIESWAHSNIGLSGAHGNEERQQCRNFVANLGSAGFLKYCVPKKWAGMFESLDVRTLCLARETLGRYSALADFSFAMQGLGSYPIALGGSDALKDRYLPAVASGKMIAAFALSEEQSGSDVAAITTSAKLDGLNYIIDGTKSWISNAGIADFYVVFARTGEAEGAKGLSAFVVEAGTPGFEVSKLVEITSPHPVGSLKFTKCKIPVSNLIGKSGDGFKIAMATLDVFRSTVGAAALGFARRALDEALAHAKARKLFGQQLSDFQMTQQKIADMATAIDASALLIYRAAWAKDTGAERVTREAAMAKMYATEAAQQVIDHAVQILGGAGVVRDSVVEHLYRDIRPLRIYEGTTEIQKLIIAGQVIGA
jgi:acyl-CoA dehydrogenase